MLNKTAKVTPLQDQRWAIEDRMIIQHISGKKHCQFNGTWGLPFMCVVKPHLRQLVLSQRT